MIMDAKQTHLKLGALPARISARYIPWNTFGWFTGLCWDRKITVADQVPSPKNDRRNGPLFNHRTSG